MAVGGVCCLCFRKGATRRGERLGSWTRAAGRRQGNERFHRGEWPPRVTNNSEGGLGSDGSCVTLM